MQGSTSTTNCREHHTLGPWTAVPEATRVGSPCYPAPPTFRIMSAQKPPPPAAPLPASHAPLVRADCMRRFLSCVRAKAWGAQDAAHKPGLQHLRPGGAEMQRTRPSRPEGMRKRGCPFCPLQGALKAATGVPLGFYQLYKERQTWGSAQQCHKRRGRRRQCSPVPPTLRAMPAQEPLPTAAPLPTHHAPLVWSVCLWRLQICVCARPWAAQDATCKPGLQHLRPGGAEMQRMWPSRPEGMRKRGCPVCALEGALNATVGVLQGFSQRYNERQIWGSAQKRHEARAAMPMLSRAANSQGLARPGTTAHSRAFASPPCPFGAAGLLVASSELCVCQALGGAGCHAQA
eukprot:evm.model.scf_1651.4 EVM.evm.TU.scf_1651.4   scf_1651:25859-28873(+)